MENMHLLNYPNQISQHHICRYIIEIYYRDIIEIYNRIDLYNFLKIKKNIKIYNINIMIYENIKYNDTIIIFILSNIRII
jgi:hypothetical protein